MAERIRQFDWSRTPLGPRSAWPQSLRTTLSVVLNSGFPMYLLWGESLISLYNDAYVPVLGDKPDALGRPFREVWADAWPEVGGLVEKALAGQSVYLEDFPVTLQRYGHPEQTWWTFSYSPVRAEGGAVAGMLCVVSETTAAVKARSVLSAERERLTRLFDQAPSFIAFLSGPAHVYELVNQAQRRLAPGRDILGKPVREAFPELVGQGIFELLDQVYRTGEPHVASGLGVMLPDGEGGLRQRYVDFVYQPVRNQDGVVTGIFVEGHDVTRRVILDAEIREREERLRLAVGAGRMGVWEIDPAGVTLVASADLTPLLGLPAGPDHRLEDVARHLYPGERERLWAIVDEARERRDRFFEAECRYIRPDNGELRWFLIRGRTDIADDQSIRRHFGVLMDVTDRKEAEERVLLLAREVDHRANNLLASVKSVVSLTRAEDIATFRANVLGRIKALAHAHDLLAQTRWTGAGLSRVVEEELSPFVGEKRVEVSGPDAKLSPAVAEALAIVLHELATNAVKYGALSTLTGAVRVAWERPDGDRFVHMTWEEHGGPPVQAPARAGFGTSLLRRAFAGGVGGAVELDWRPEGLCCRLRFPAL